MNEIHLMCYHCCCGLTSFTTAVRYISDRLYILLYRIVVAYPVWGLVSFLFLSLFHSLLAVCMCTCIYFCV